MPRDLQELLRRTEVLVESSKELCVGSLHAIQRSKSLIEAITALQNGDGDASECAPKASANNTATPQPISPRPTPESARVKG